MDPLTSIMPGMSGSPSFQGGDAAPSFATATGGDNRTNSWMASSFSVGTGSSAESSAPVGLGGSEQGVLAPSNLLPVGLAGVALLVALVAIKRS